MTWQLWLARQECVDSPLPWQAPQEKLAPDRVAQAFASILVAIATRSTPPKNRAENPLVEPKENVRPPGLTIQR